MEQDKLDIRNKTKEELIDSYNLIAHSILDDLKKFEDFNKEKTNEEKVNTYISNVEFKEKDLI